MKTKHLMVAATLSIGLLACGNDQTKEERIEAEARARVDAEMRYRAEIFEERRQLSKALNEARQLALALRLYAQDNNGIFPGTLEQLVEGLYLPEDAMIEGIEVDGRMVPWLYRAGLNDSAQGDTPILMLAEPIHGEWIIASVNAATKATPDADPVELGFPVPER